MAQGHRKCEDSEDGIMTGPPCLRLSESEKGMFHVAREGRGESEEGEGFQGG